MQGWTEVRHEQIESDLVECPCGPVRTVAARTGTARSMKAWMLVNSTGNEGSGRGKASPVRVSR